MLTRQVLYQLSYTGLSIFLIFIYNKFSIPSKHWYPKQLKIVFIIGYIIIIGFILKIKSLYPPIVIRFVILSLDSINFVIKYIIYELKFKYSIATINFLWLFILSKLVQNSRNEEWNSLIQLTASKFLIIWYFWIENDIFPASYNNNP